MFSEVEELARVSMDLDGRDRSGGLSKADAAAAGPKLMADDEEGVVAVAALKGAVVVEAIAGEEVPAALGRFIFGDVASINCVKAVVLFMDGKFENEDEAVDGIEMLRESLVALIASAI